MNPVHASLLLAFLLSAAFTIGTVLKPRAESWNRRSESGSLFQMVFGEGRRLFANHFFVQADVYFHSGYYPSIFEQARKAKNTDHLKGEHDDGEDHGAPHKCDHPGDVQGVDHDHHEHDDHDHESEHYKQMAMDKPKDFIERFGRRFIITSHTHLGGGSQREMLPWLKLSAEMDPQRTETYTVAAYWLNSMGKHEEAEQFLRLGLKHNPRSYELLSELAQCLAEYQKDDTRARNLWRTALQRWSEQEPGKEDPDRTGCERILLRLASLERRNGKLSDAIQLLGMAKKLSPNPAAVERQIEDLKQGSANPSGNNAR